MSSSPAPPRNIFASTSWSDGSSSGGDEGALDSAGESSSGEPPIDDGSLSSTDDGPPPPDDPMYSPCDPDEQACADGICLKIEDEYGNLLSAYCTGLCGIPQNDWVRSTSAGSTVSVPGASETSSKP